MKFSFYYVMAAIGAVVCIPILLNMIGKVYDVGQSLEEIEFNSYVDGNYYIITKNSAMKTQCSINVSHGGSYEILDIALSDTFNERIDISDTGSYIFEITCCSLDNKCTKKRFEYIS